jgi:hypothetical protein
MAVMTNEGIEVKSMTGSSITERRVPYDDNKDLLAVISLSNRKRTVQEVTGMDSEFQSFGTSIRQTLAHENHKQRRPEDSVSKIISGRESPPKNAFWWMNSVDWGITILRRAMHR